MAILTKCHHLFSSLYKQLKPSRKSEQQIIPPSRLPPSPPPSPSPLPQIDRDMGATAQALKHIPRIKFPQRHPKPSGLFIYIY